VLLNAYNDNGVAVNTGKTKYMDVRRRRGVMRKEHIVICSNI
jgi:hypothetical protein